MRFTSLRKVITKWFLLGLVVVSGAAILSAAYQGEKWVDKELEYVREHVVPVAEAMEIEVDRSMPVLERIKNAESGGNQFCTEELAKSKRYEDCYAGRVGMVLMNVNTNGSIDWGICQINDFYWGVKARELGFDIMTLEGNEEMCDWLFANHGTEPWSASKANWK